mmetsp:Transcript_17431/g.48143  ORF Transcript_17431/g.48143 Transcript_17431/m.48143 type:complete len:89 (-) Transcript_17431:294-560(-)
MNRGRGRWDKRNPQLDPDLQRPRIAAAAAAAAAKRATEEKPKSVDKAGSLEGIPDGVLRGGSGIGSFLVVVVIDAESDGRHRESGGEP